MLDDWYAQGCLNERNDVLHQQILAGLIAFATLPCWSAPLVSGDYDGLLIGVDRNGAITGYFESSTGAGKFNCIFFISGAVNGKRSRVDTWFPKDKEAKQVIRGVLEQTATDPSPSIRLTLTEEHGGCMNVQHFVGDPSTFTLSEQGDWQSIRVIAANKAYFHDAPTGAKPRKAYAVQGNPVRVFETRAGWVKAEYVSEDARSTSGWIREADLFSPVSPAAR